MTAATMCRSCGTEPLQSARFCHSCGAPIAAETPAEYKQVTVLFADVVHSMDIAAAVGPERLREIMAELVSRAAVVVQRYGGTVDKFTGDGIMAVFGAPIALEDHAARACAAALGIQDEAARLAVEVQARDGVYLQLRVGLNSGQVIAGEVGSAAMGYTAVGEHVGLAQRMESVAPPGGVMLSASTARLVENSALFGEPEIVHVKGSAEPLSARRLVGMTGSHGVGRQDSKLVGRRWEMAAAEGLLERSINGDGAVVALVAPAGIGKSRTVREIAGIAAARGVDIFWAFCESHTLDIPFHAVGQLMRAVAGVPGLDDATARTQLRERISDADEQDVVLFDDLAGIRDPATPVPEIDPDARRRRLLALVKAAAIARETPALYVVEDAHWIDEVSDSMLADFMTVLPQTHSMMLITYRPEFDGGVARVPGAQTLTLAPLSNSESSALASDLLGPHPSVSDLATTIVARAAGNPFFVEEIVRDLAERGVISGRRGAYVCRTNLAEITVPATLQATISARIDRLQPDAKRTLCGAAVVGTVFDTNLLRSIGVDADVEALLRAELINQIKFTPHAEYAFRHPLIRTVAYESQLKADRAALHRRLAGSIDQVDENAALIAEHLEAAGDFREAYAWHMRAGAWSMNRDNAAAHVSWERARQIADALPDEEPDRLAMRIAPRTLMCGHGFRIHSPLVGARFAELQELCTAAGDKASPAIAMAGLTGDHMVSGRIREARDSALELTALLEAIDEPSLMVELAIAPLAMAMTSGDMAEMLRLSELVIDLADADAGNPRVIIGSPLAYAYASRSVARWAHGHDGWRSDFDRAVAIARSADLMSKGVALAVTYGMAIGYDVILVDDITLRDLQEALETCERSADDLALAFALFTLGMALVCKRPAEPEHGLRLLTRSRDMALADRFYRSHLPVIDAYIGWGMARGGDHAASLPIMRSGVDGVFETGQFGYCGAARFLVKGLLAHSTDANVREAEAAIDRLAGVHALQGLVIQDLTLLELRALLACAKGNTVAYRQLANRYRDLANSLGFEGHIASAEAMS